MAEKEERTQIPCLFVDTSKAQSALEQLRAKGWLDERYQVGKKEGRIVVPIRQNCVEQVENAHMGDVGDFALSPLKQRPVSLQKELIGILTADQLAELGSSFDIVGDIAQLELTGELQTKQAAIAAAIMRIYPHVKTVVKKAQSTGGPYRIRPVEVIAGEKRTRTISKENGISLVVDLNKAYYNARVASERMRIVEQIGKEKAHENVLVLFAGVGPYAILAEKKTDADAKPQKIIAIELNPDAVEMMNENIALNKCKKIEAICGDVVEVLTQPRFVAWADRIIMPHPSDSLRFLPSALRAASKDAIIHLYAFSPAEEPLPPLLKDAQEIATREGYSLSLLDWRVVRTYSPNLVQIVLDLRVKAIS